MMITKGLTSLFEPSLRLVLRLELYILALPATLFFLVGILFGPVFFWEFGGLAGLIFGVPALLIYGYWMYAFWNLALHRRDQPLRDIPKRVKIGLGVGYAMVFLFGLSLLSRAVNNEPVLDVNYFLVFLGPVIPCTHLLALAWRAERATRTTMGSGLAK